MSTYPFHRLLASTASITSTAAIVDRTTASDLAVSTTGLQFSWPELTLEIPCTAVTSSNYLQLVTNAVASLDLKILRCLFSLSTSQRRGMWVALLTTGLVGGAYASYTVIWPYVKPHVDTCVWDMYLAPRFSMGETSADTTKARTDANDVKRMEATNDATEMLVNDTGTPASDDDVKDDRAPPSSLPYSRQLTDSLSNVLLPNVFQRALDAVRSHQLTYKAATATTVLLERQDHQWYTTLREHVSAGAVIVGIAVRVPATLLLAPTDEVVTLNRWLEVNVRRAPPSNSPVCLWSNDVGDTYNTDVDSADPHPAESGGASTLPDGLYLSALLRDVVSHQFKYQQQPLPALQYRVHNQLCAPEHAMRYGLEVATIVAGVVCGCALSATAAESSLATHASLSSWATTDVGPRCEREWTQYEATHLPKRVPSPLTEQNDGIMDATIQPPPQFVRSPLNIQSRIAAALWESDDDDSDPNEEAHEADAAVVPPLTTVQLSEDDPTTVNETSPTHVHQPIVVCGQLVRAPNVDAEADSPTEWPSDAIAQTLAQHLDEVIRPHQTLSPPLRHTIHINAQGELYVLTHAPIGLTVKQLLVQACKTHGCTLQLHCLARVYRAGTASTCKVRQTWLSSVELV